MNVARKFGVQILTVVLSAGFAVLAAAPSNAQSSAPSKKATAKNLLASADALRAGFVADTMHERTKRGYEAVISAYRRVVAAGPATSEAQAAIMAEAELCREMARDFGNTYSERAIATYQALLTQYPTSRYRADAMFTIARIEQDDLGRLDDAQQSFAEFLDKFPHSARAGDAQEALKEIAARRQREAAAAHASAAGPAAKISDDRQAAPAHATRVTAIRQWNADNYTRVVISLEGEVKYQAARIANPDRIYFDLYTAHISPAMAAKSIEFESGFLKSVRVAQNQAGVVRVVLEVDKVKDFSVFLLKDPYRLVVDVYGESGTTTAKAAAPPVAPVNTDKPAEKAPPSDKTDKSAASTARNAKTADATPKKPSGSADVATALTGDTPSAATVKPANTKSSPAADKPAKTDAQTVSAKSPKSNTKPLADTAKAEVAENDAPDDPPAHSPASAVSTAPRKSVDADDLVAAVPQPDHRGKRSLTRTLGLKIGKIVIDAGHGGHDTGTIGPTGLEEKDLTLDVALRLGKLIEQKLGAEVVYTRSDDTFVPLEERTALANQVKADLFVSIHANSSNDPAARGIETYYLNLTDSPEARAVAARENALSQASIHDLQDLVQKIARNEKIDESRELANEVQIGLAKRMQRANHAQKNRGVKRAPFVVLLGANMPSILTEISFISNPNDEAALKKGDQRQHVAEGILAGISHYLESLGSAPHAALLTSPAVAR